MSSANLSPYTKFVLLNPNLCFVNVVNCFSWNLPFLLVHSFQTSKTDSDFCLQQQYEKDYAGKLGDQLENLWNQQQYYTSDKKPSLSRALMKMFGIQFLLLGVFLFLLEFFSAIGTAFILKLILNSYEDDAKNVFLLCCIAGFLAVVKQIAHHYCLLNCSRLETEARIACCSLIHRKSLKLKLSCEALQQTDEIRNLLLAHFNMKYFHLAANAAASLAVIPIFCYPFAENNSILFNFLVCIAFASARYCFGRKSLIVDQLKKLNKDTLKEYALLSTLFEMLLHKFWLILATTFFPQKDLLYISLVLFENVKTLTDFTPRVLEHFLRIRQLVQSFERLFLNEDVFKRQSPTRRNRIFKRKQKRIVIKNGWAKCDDSSRILLRRVNFQAKQKQLTAIVGGPSSGKSSLLSVLLGETLLQQGKLETAVDVSYSSQTPWIFPGSVRENILFNQEMDAEKYEEVVESCALRDDFPNGEDTLLDLQLSDEQKTKINLARAAYRSAGVYLLDEPLSKLSPETAKKVYEKCICGYLRKKCIVLACNPGSWELLVRNNVQSVYLMQSGAVISNGSCKKLAKSFDLFFVRALHQQNQSKRLIDQCERSQIVGAGSLREDPEVVYVFGIFQLFLVFVLLQVIGLFLDFLLMMNNFATSVLVLFALGFIYVYVCSNLGLWLILHEKAELIFNAVTGLLVSGSKTSANVTVLVEKTVAGFVCAGSLALVLLLVDEWTLLATAVLWMVVFYVDLKVIPARKQLKTTLIKHMNTIEARMLSSVRGVATIRAFKAQNKLINEFDALHDRFRSINYAILSLKTSTSFWTGLFTFFYVAFVNLHKVFTLGNENFGKEVGLALAQSLMVFASSIMVSSFKSF